MTVRGVRTVTAQEFRVRLRTGRWRWLLAAWFAVIAGFTVLLRLSLSPGDSPGYAVPYGVPMFDGLMLFVLGLALLIAPVLASQSINGDRERGTLATLQVTRLSAAEIAVGKLLAAWGTACVFLALTLPLVIWSIAEGGIGLRRAPAVLTVVALLMGVVIAISQALSALFARSITSALLAYLTVFALTVGTLIAFSFGLAISADVTRTETYVTTVEHRERVWWLLAPNPFVILSDAAPQLPPRRDPATGELRYPSDVLGDLGRLARSLRVPEADDTEDSGSAASAAAGPVWTYGLAFDVVLGAGALWVTTRRLRTPYRRLHRGVRIA